MCGHRVVVTQNHHSYMTVLPHYLNCTDNTGKLNLKLKQGCHIKFNQWPHREMGIGSRFRHRLSLIADHQHRFSLSFSFRLGLGLIHVWETCWCSLFEVFPGSNESLRVLHKGMIDPHDIFNLEFSKPHWKHSNGDFHLVDWLKCTC